MPDHVALIHRFYEGLWNEGRLEVADEILAEDIRFRGSLGTEVEGRDGFLGYVERVRAAFPDFHNRIDDLIDAGDRAVVRLTCTGTHQGDVFGIAPTGRRISYVAIAIFKFGDEMIEEGWVVGDTHEVWRVLDGAE
jgi:steroid delta-isomerase-like uncharacterized protein